jgi:hypothetical protein
MTVGDFANADPAPAPLYAREVKATMAEAGLPAEAELRFPVRIRIGIPRDGLDSRGVRRSVEPRMFKNDLHQLWTERRRLVDAYRLIRLAVGART